MARIITASPLDHRDECHDGIVARARASALRVALPLGRRRALRRLIAAADARRQIKEFA